MIDHIDAFREFAQSAGIPLSGDIFTDGKLHRIHAEGDKKGSRNAWYFFHTDEPVVGGVGSWKSGVTGKFTLKPETVMTPAELDQIARRMEAIRQEREAEEEKLHAECRRWCSNIFPKAKPADPNHPYFRSKGVKAYGVKALKKMLMIPLRDSAGELQGAQFIAPDGTKKFKTGTNKKGSYFSIGQPKDNILIICEGYATGASLHECTGYAVAVAFDAGNIKPVSEVLREKFPNIKIIIAADNDESGTGQAKAQEAAQAIGGFIAIPPTPGEDFNDMHQHAGHEAVNTLIQSVPICDVVTDKTSCDVSVSDSDLRECPGIKGCDVVTDNPTLEGEVIFQAPDTTVLRLAKLSPLEYDKVRKEAAGNLGVRATVLDQAVKEARNGCVNETDLPFKNIEPWTEPVNPAEILSEIAAVVRRFIVCDREISTAVALWSAMTWFLDVVHVAPLAVITAPEKRCGKSQLLTLLGRIACRPITASSISPAALFRAIDAWGPTLLIDEVDACMKDNEELRGLINSGHTRDSAFVIRAVGETFTPTKFSTWGAKALSGIGHVADTLMDRAIILELRRKLSHEQVDRLRYAEHGLFDTLAAKLSRFSYDYSEQVRQARPALPSSLNDRAQDNWEPLLAIAMTAGPEWLDTATKAAMKLSGGESAAESIGVELLSDIQEIFDTNSIDRISTANLIQALIEDDEKPWATYNRGLPIKPRQIASRLKGYGIISKTVRFNQLETAKGYDRRQFEESFYRYVTPPEISVTESQVNTDRGLSVTDRQHCDVTKPVVTDNMEVF